MFRTMSGCGRSADRVGRRMGCGSNMWKSATHAHWFGATRERRMAGTLEKNAQATFFVGICSAARPAFDARARVRSAFRSVGFSPSSFHPFRRASSSARPPWRSQPQSLRPIPTSASNPSTLANLMKSTHFKTPPLVPSTPTRTPSPPFTSSNDSASAISSSA